MASARDWILVLFGRFIRERTGWVSVRQLIELLEPLGTDAAAIRTAVSRMKRSGFVESDLRDGIAGYRLTADGEALFADGDRRILERTVADDRWVLASFSVPESKRSIRHKIRSCLFDIGFGQASSGLLIAPVGLIGEAERTLRREELDVWVSMWIAEFASLGSIADVVEHSWDTTAIRQRYDFYIAQANDFLSQPQVDDAVIFVGYMHLINDWRELRYLDPGLPANALAGDWPQPEASRLFDEIERQLRPAADQYYDQMASHDVISDGQAGAPVKVSAHA